MHGDTIGNLDSYRGFTSTEMKIHCSVEVLNRSLPSLNIRGKKSVRSSLTIVKSNQDIIIVHQTNENLNGNKYKVKGHYFPYT